MAQDSSLNLNLNAPPDSPFVPGTGGGVRFSFSSLTPFLAGAVLISAALLKTDQLGNEPMSERSWGLVALIEVELALGFALAAKIWPRLVRSLALLLFAAFGGVALSKAAAGAPSCGCAGNLEITPWLAVFLDLGILAALWVWPPKGRARFNRVKAVLAISYLAALPWPLWAAFQPAPYPRLVARPLTELGKLSPGESRTFVLTLKNPHEKPVEIANLDFSCPCLEAKGLPLVLAPRGEKTLDLVLDLSPEPGFTGSLLIKVKGKTKEGDIAFVTKVTVGRMNFQGSW